MLSKLTAQQRVANGAAWLDADRPGWRDQISDLERLDISDGFMCVLGQTGGYGAGCEQIMRQVGPEHSGDAIVEMGFAGTYYGLSGLNAEWKRVIAGDRTRAPDRQLTPA